MKSRWLMVALLLSLGINLGLVIGSLSNRRAQGAPTTTEHVTPSQEDTATPPEAPPSSEPAPSDPSEPPPDRATTDRAPRRDPPPFLQRMADDLGLEGELRRRFLGQQMRFLAHTLEGRRRLGELQASLRREVTSESPDRQQIDRLLQESARIHYRLERTFVENLLAGREVLDEGQQRRYFEMLNRWRRARETRRFLERRRNEEGERRPLRGGPAVEGPR